MVNQICDILAQDFAGLNFVSKSAGVMEIFKKPMPKGKEKVLPVARKIYTGSEILTCDVKTPYYELLPNGKESCIIYFEDKGAKLQKKNKRYSTFKGKLKLVCWANTKLIDPQIDPKTIRAAVRSTLREHIPLTGQILGTKIKVAEIAPNRPHPFEKFTIDEALKQFLTHPYTYFVLDIDYICNYSNHCSEDIILNPATC